MLPAFRRLEDHFLGESEHHGTGGGWRIEAPRLSWDILDAVGDAAEEMGIRKIADFNTGDNEGVGYFHVNQKRGRRWSSARGFLKPVLKRPNLRLEKNVLVDRLIVEQGRAVGVRFMQGGETVEARAKGEVILCAGSIGSIQVLHRSGIGPADWLEPLGIETVLDRQGVGRNLQDHLQQRAIYKVEGVRTLNETYYSLVGRGLMGLDYAFRRRGPLTMAPSQLGIFTRSDPHRERANIQFHVQPLSLDKFGDPLHRFPAITVSACNLQPTSRGTVRIRSSEPDAGARDRAELSVDRRRPRGRRRRHPHHAAADAAAGAGALSPGRVPAGPIGRRRRCLAGKGRRRYRHHDLSSRRHREDGDGQRSPGGGRRTPALLRACRTSRRRRLGDADHHLRQYQHPDRDDRRKGRGDDPGG